METGNDFTDFNLNRERKKNRKAVFVFFMKLDELKGGVCNRVFTECALEFSFKFECYFRRSRQKIFKE